jgi:hemoglobin-like flavoprotein
MGARQSNTVFVDANRDFDAINTKQQQFDRALTVPLSVQVSHFTPSSFPLVPRINSSQNKLCVSSWNTIIEQEGRGADGKTLSGITMFYEEFYERLKLFDSRGMFEAVLTRNSGTLQKSAVKGAILIRIMKFALTLKEDSDDVQMQLFILGKSHAQKQIRPWQYSVFVETLLNTVGSRLGSDATADVMRAWVNLFAFILKSMLPPAIKGSTLTDEINVNTNTIFDD